jgi:hypothetical protein
VSLVYRLLDNGPAFMVVDAATRGHPKGELASHALARNDVVGRPMSGRIFGLCDATLAQDQRLAELLDGWTLKSE